MPVTLTAPVDKGETFEVLTTQDVVGELRARVPDLHRTNEDGGYVKKMVQEGKFPEPWLWTRTRSFWLREDVYDWIDQRLATDSLTVVDDLAARLEYMDATARRKLFSEVEKKIKESK